MEKNVATQTTVNGPSRQSLIGATLVGAIVGLSGWLLTLAIQYWLIEAVFCRSADTFSVCANGGNIAWVTAHLVVVIASVVALVRVNVYRPLMVVIASLLALWGLGAWLAPMAWYFFLGWEVVLFALAYTLFTWLASLERFIFSLFLTIAVVVVVRLAFSL